jgi:gliding motility-associated-like protein
VAIAAPEQLTCVQTSATITANLPSSIPSFSANWTTSNGHFVSGQNSLLAVVDQPGDYFLSVTNLQNGCSMTEQTTVFQNIVPPGADAGPAPELHCNQPQATLSGSSPTSGNIIFAWSTANGHFVGGTTTSSPTVDAPGTYSLTVTDPANGCTSTDEVAVTEILPPTFEPELLQPDCHETKGAVDFASVSNGKPPFQYSTNGGQTFANQSFIANLSPGFYDLIVRDAYGCTAAASAEIGEPFIPTVTLPNMVKIEMGEVVYLQPVINQLFSNIVSWEWSPTDGLTCTDCAYPIAKPLRFSVYTLKITDLNGCEASAKVQIQVDRRRYIYAPNVFSPDGDGENDKFTIYGRGVREVRSLQVFDRWGAEIFSVKNLEINDEERGWDGTFRGQTLNPAVFVWQASIEFEDGEVEVFAGDVTVQR